MDLLPISHQEFKLFFLILIRVSVILFLLPFFSSRVIPVLSKAGLCLIVAIVLFPVVHISETVEFPDHLWEMIQLVITEFIIGMILGLIVEIFFEGVKMMGQLVGFQTGFAIVNILDPQSGTQVSILSNMAYFVAIALFLILNGHHIMLKAMRESFEIINVGSLNLNAKIFETFMRDVGEMFVIAVKIGAPAIAALIFTQAVFGLITKLIPQMNIMIVAFPVQIIIGLVFFGVCLNTLLRFTEVYISDLNSVLMNTMFQLKV
ncbi:MAG TPA: flagellar biosynthetic protein FliR [Desulfatiglandales bacterium]|nr:flagellar biosynthetic protein FliR [Desulfatiglandales bacterium]